MWPTPTYSSYSKPPHYRLGQAWQIVMDTDSRSACIMLCIKTTDIFHSNCIVVSTSGVANSSCIIYNICLHKTLAKVLSAITPAYSTCHLCFEWFPWLGATLYSCSLMHLREQLESATWTICGA